MNLNLLATTSIEFPNLHISLNNLPKSFSLFGVDIAFYGVIIAFGMLAGIALVCYDAKSSGQDYNLYIDFAIDRKSTRLNSSHTDSSRMPSSA